MSRDANELLQFLGFTLDQEIYAIEIKNVREVLDCIKIRPVPQMPEYMKGAINLRGNVVPILDLRIKFNMHIIEDTVNTCIIIVELPIDGEITPIGIIADSVKEVLTIESTTIGPPPKIGTRLHTDFIKGMSKRGEDFIILLDLIKVFTQEELSTLQSGNELSHAQHQTTEALA